MELPDSNNDAELLAGLQSGNEAAYVDVLNRYEAAMYRFFLFSHADRDLAEDQVCDTFAALVAAAPRLKPEGLNLRAYIYGIARNVKRSAVRCRTDSVLSEDVAAMVADPGLPARETAERGQDFERAMAAMMGLAEPARQVMLLRFVEEMPLGLIAAALDIREALKLHNSLQRKKLIAAYEVIEHCDESERLSMPSTDSSVAIS